MVLVTGSTGLVGSHLLFFLLKEGKKVRAIHRSTSDLNEVKKVFSYYTEDIEPYFSKIEWVEANILDIPALSSAFEGILEVYHTAAFISFNPKHFPKLLKTNVEGTANIVNLCLSNQVKKLCYVSSIATLGAPKKGELIHEEIEFNPEEDNSVYAITKHGGEMEVWRGTQEGLNAVIIKPGVILGEGHWKSSSSTIFKKVFKGLKYYTTGGVGFVDVQDVVKAMILGMRHEANQNAFIVVGENKKYQEILSMIATQFQKKIPKKKLSKSILLLYCNIDWFLNKLFNTKRKVSKGMVNSLYTTTFYSTEKIKTELNFSFTPIEKTIERICENYQNNY